MFELLDISAGYGETAVLHDVTIRVPPGSVVALLGANGAGKTTLLRVASGLLRPTSGEIVCDATTLTGRPAHDFVAQGVCHVPEGRGIFRSMTVRDNLLLQSPKGGETMALEQASEVFPALGRRMGQLAGTLSGGEQQMLALARAYVSNPSFVFLDEVSLGLAPIIVDEIFEFLRLLAESGAALLLVEQYVVRALRLADYVYVLARGEVSFAGEPGELDEDAVFRNYVGAAV
jgi:branched-chain amino acid transport system ATP-binding protein